MVTKQTTHKMIPMC